jgi:membrane-bound metal-dependent hydrolase YbcI (DUF457 family)
MAQAGIHGMVAQAVHKWVPKREWLMLGIVFGSLFPDADNLLVAIATVTKQPVEGLHRTFTHSVIVALVLFLVFWAIGALRKQPRWTNFGAGFAIGIVLHALLDLLIWFNGVQLFWPFPLWINFWAGVAVPGWFMTLMDPLEFLFLGLFFYMLLVLARKHQTDTGFLRALKVWMIVELVLFIIFLPLLYTPVKIVYTVYGLLYLVSLIAALVITVRMRATVEAV